MAKGSRNFYLSLLAVSALAPIVHLDHCFFATRYYQAQCRVEAQIEMTEQQIAEAHHSHAQLMRQNGNAELATDRIAAGPPEVRVSRWSGIHNVLPCRLTGPKVGFDPVKRGGGRRRSVLAVD